jgi:hypothetical protein
MKAYNLTRYMIYQTIKNDPSFPALDIGPKKNYRIDLYKFEEWLARRSAITGNNNDVPTGKDLLKECGYAKYQ